MTRIVIAFAIAISLSGCILADQTALSPEAVARFRLTDVTVDFTPDAAIHYSDAEDEPVSAPGDSVGPAVVRAHVIERSKQVIKAAFLSELGPRLAGDRPVIVHVHVARLWVPGPLATVLVGGSASLQAGVDLADAKTGATLVAFAPNQGTGSAMALGGIGGLLINAAVDKSTGPDGRAGRLARNFASDYATWLLKQ